MSPHVDIITRTKNRPNFMKRCLADIDGQSFKDFRWIVVNDGGDPVAIADVVNEARSRGVNTIFESLPTSVGMEAAANRGASLGDAPLIVIHDDDDTWAPDFLQRMTQSMQESDYVGAVSWSNEVLESVDAQGRIKICTRRKSEFCPSVVGIHSLLVRNCFPPIALLFRRDAFDACGRFNENLKVLGDWDFNLRLIQLGDFLVVPERLANYHIRTGSSPMGNSVVSGRSDHQNVTAELRNRYLRTDLEQGRLGIGSLMTMAAITETIASKQSFSERWRRFKRRFGLS